MTFFEVIVRAVFDRMRMRKGLRSVLWASTALTVGASTPVMAQTWDSAVDGDWNVGGNWTGGAFPNAPGDSATLDSDVGSGTITVDLQGNTYQLDSLTIDDTDTGNGNSATFALTNGTLDFSNNGNLDMTADAQASLTMTGTLETSGGAGGLTASIASGKTFIVDGTLDVTSGGLTLDGAGTFTFVDTASGTISNGIIDLSTSDSNFEISNANALAVGTSFDGTGTLIKSDAGTLTLSGSSGTASGVLSILEGTVVASSGSAIGDSVNVLFGELDGSNQPIAVPAGTGLELTSSETIGGLGIGDGAVVNLNGNNLTIGGLSNPNDAEFFYGSFAGSGDVIHNATGQIFRLEGADTGAFTGDLLINSGIVAVDGADNGNNVIGDTVDVVVSGGGFRLIQGASETIGSLSASSGTFLNVQENSTLTVGTAATSSAMNWLFSTITVDGTVINGSNHLINITDSVSGSGTIQTNGTGGNILLQNSFSSGTLEIEGGTGTVQAGTLGAATMNGGTLELDGTVNVSGGVTVSGNANGANNINVTTGNAATITGLTSDLDVAFNTGTDGTLTVAGSVVKNVPVGVTLGDGTLVIGSTNVGSNLLSDSLDFTAASAGIELDGIATTVGNVTGASGSFTNSGTNDANLTFDNSANTDIGGAIDGNVNGLINLVKTGAGDLTLSGDSSFIGSVEVQQATLIVANANAFDTTTELNLNGGNLTLNNALNLSVGSLTGTSGTLNLDGTSSLTLTALASTEEDFDGQLSGPGALVLNSSGDRLNLTGDNSAYTGTAEVADGVLAVSGAFGGNVDVTGGRLLVADTVFAGDVDLQSGNILLTTDVSGAITATTGAVEIIGGSSGASDVEHAISDLSFNQDLTFRSLEAGGVIAVTGTVTNTGAANSVTVDEGTLQIGSASAGTNLFANGAVIDAGSDVDINGNATSMTNLTNGTNGAGAVNNSGAAATLTLTNNVNSTFDGDFGSGVNIDKEGAATLTLSGTILGTATVNAGTLDVSGSAASIATTASGAQANVSGTVDDVDVALGTVVIENGATMTGTGSVAGSGGVIGELQVDAGGQIDVGASVTVSSDGLLDNYGDILGSVDVSGGTLDHQSGASLSGAISLNSGTLNNFGDITGAVTANEDGEVVAEAGSSFGDITLNAATGGGADGLLTINDSFTIGGDLVSNGQIVTNVAAGTYTVDLGSNSFTHEGSLTILGTGYLQFDAGELITSDNATESGDVLFNVTTLTNSGTLTIDANQLYDSVGAYTTAIAGGYTGTGYVYQNLQNDGNMTVNSDLAGDFTTGATGNTTINGISAGGYEIDNDGSTTLTGTLSDVGIFTNTGGGATVTFNAGAALESNGAVRNLAGGFFDIEGDSTITSDFDNSGGETFINRGTVTTDTTNVGAITLTLGDGVNTQVMENIGAGILDIGTNDTVTGATAEIRNTGTINLATGALLDVDTLTLNGGNVNNAGTIAVGTLTTGTNSTITNSGTITTAFTSNGTVNNTGTMSGALVVADGTFDHSGAGDLTNTISVTADGRLNSAANISGTLSVDGGRADLTGGTVTNAVAVTAGALHLEGATLSAGASASGGTIYVNSGAGVVASTLGVSGSGLIRVNADTVNDIVQTGGAVRANGGTVVLGTVTDGLFIGNGGDVTTLDISANGEARADAGTITTANVTGGLFTGNGGTVTTLNVSGGDAQADAGGIQTANVTGGKLTVETNGSVQTVDASGGRVVNKGSVTTADVNAGGDFRSDGQTGILNALGGDVILRDSSTTTTLNNSASTVNIVSGATVTNANTTAAAALTLNRGTVTNASVSDGLMRNHASVTGTLAVTGVGAQFTNQTTGVLSANSTVSDGLLLNVGSGEITGDTTVSGSGEMRIVEGSVSGATTVNSGGLLTVKGGVMTGTTTVNTGGTLTVDTSVGAPDWMVRVAGGTADVTGGTIGDMRVTNAASVVTNSAFGTITDLDQRNGTVNNRSTITTATHSGGDFNNATNGNVTTLTSSGGIAINDGTISRANVSGGDVTNNNFIQTADVSSGTLTNGDAVTTLIQTGGTVSNSGTITDSATITDGDFFVESGGAVTALVSDGAGAETVIRSGGSAGRITQSAGVIRQRGTVTSSTTISGGTFVSTGNTADVEVSGGSASITNGSIDSVTVSGGTFETAGGTTDSITVDAGGTAVLAAGTVTNAVSNAGTTNVTGTATADINNESGGETTVRLAGILDGNIDNLSGATLNLIGDVNGTVTQSEGGTLNITDGAGAGALILETDYTLTNAINMLSGGQTTLQAGRVLTLSGGSINDGALENNGTLTVDGSGSVGGLIAGAGSTIDLADGATDDIFTIAGDADFGTSSQVLMDVNLETGAGDLIEVSGDASGTFAIEITDLGTPTDSLDAPITLVEIDGDSSALDLELTGLPTEGAVVYSSGINQTTGDVQISSGLNPAIGGLASGLALTQSLIGSVVNRPSSPFVSGLAAAEEDPCGIGAWGRAVGGVAKATGSTSVAEGEFTSELGATFGGVQVGADYSCFNGYFNGWDLSFGLIGGYNRGITRQPVFSFDGNFGGGFTDTLTATNETIFSQVYGGGYIGVAKDRFFADVQYRYDRTTFDLRHIVEPGFDGIGVSDQRYTSRGHTISGTASYAYSLNADKGINIIPTAGFSFSRLNSDNILFENDPDDPNDDGVMVIDPINSRMGFVGVTLSRSKVLPSGTAAINYFGTATVYNDFAAPSRSVYYEQVDGNGDPVGTGIESFSSNIGLYGEVSAGLSYTKLLDPGRAIPGRQLDASVRVDGRLSSTVQSAGITAQIRLSF